MSILFELCVGTHGHQQLIVLVVPSMARFKCSSAALFNSLFIIWHKIHDVPGSPLQPATQPPILL
jgi:hypothetical protein